MKADHRLVALREKLAAESIEAILVTQASNVDYITGFEHITDEDNPHAALITQTSAQFFTDSRYDEVAGVSGAGTEWNIERVTGRMIATLVERIKAANVKTLALEDGMPYGVYTEWAASFIGVDVTPAKGWLERIRWTKDANEIARIGEAQAITDAAFTSILGFIKEGVTEREIAIELEYTMLKLGADGVAFPSIVASGPNGSLPHAHPSTRSIQLGDLITLDFGAEVGGYKSDMTRTVVLGTANEKQREIYSTVLLANMASIDQCIAGRTGIEIDAAGRTIIETEGYGPNFGHGTGHGVGLDIHEGPNAGPRSTDAIPAGAVITIEPGIYVPGECGVRIEDLVLVTEDGPEVFTTSTKELIEL